MTISTSMSNVSGGRRKQRNIAAALLLLGICALGSSGCYYSEPYYGGYAPVRAGYYASYGAPSYDPYYDPYYGGGYYGPRYGGSAISIGVSSYGNRRYYGRRYPRYRRYGNPDYRRTGAYSRVQGIRSGETRSQRAATRAVPQQEASSVVERQEE
jgi:hypothetical protein